MASPLSLEELFCDLVPEEKWHLLDCTMKDDHLTVFAENLTHWQEVAPYLERRRRRQQLKETTIEKRGEGWYAECIGSNVKGRSVSTSESG